MEGWVPRARSAAQMALGGGSARADGDRGGADRGGDVAAGRDCTISPRAEVGSSCALPARSRRDSTISPRRVREKSWLRLRTTRAVALSPLKLLSPRAGSAQARQARLIARKHRLGRGRGARILLFQFLDGESKLPCPFDYELHLPAYSCKGNRHSINAMYHCKGSHGGNHSVSVILQPNAPQLDYQLDRAK